MRVALYLERHLQEKRNFQDRLKMRLMSPPLSIARLPSPPEVSKDPSKKRLRWIPDNNRREWRRWRETPDNTCREWPERIPPQITGLAPKVVLNKKECWLNWLGVLNRMKLSSRKRTLMSLSVLCFREHMSFKRKFFLGKARLFRSCSFWRNQIF